MTIAGWAGRVPPTASVVLGGSSLVGAAMAIVFWETGLVDGDVVAEFQANLAGTNSGPAVPIAVVVALVVGASMVALPCGFPAVFAVPSALRDARTRSARLATLSAFALGAVVPLALAGAALGLAGDGLWRVLADEGARKLVAAVAFSVAGSVAVAYALSEFGLLHVENLLARVTGPALPSVDAPVRRAALLGAAFGAGMGIACPMPTYYVLLGWVVVVGSPGYGALVLAAYGLGRVVVPVALGLAIVAGLSRRSASSWLVGANRWLSPVSGATMMALGSLLIVLFGGLLGSSLLSR